MTTVDREENTRKNNCNNNTLNTESAVGLMHTLTNIVYRQQSKSFCNSLNIDQSLTDAIFFAKTCTDGW